jgi:hypothetical protein
MASTGPAGAGAGAGTQTLREPTPEEVTWLEDYIKGRRQKSDLKDWYATHPFPTVYFKVIANYDPYRDQELLAETLKRLPDPMVLDSKGRTIVTWLTQMQGEAPSSGWGRSLLARAKAYEKGWKEQPLTDTKQLAKTLNIVRITQGKSLPEDVERKIGSYLSGEKGTLEEQARTLKVKSKAGRRRRRGRKTRRHRTWRE